MTKEEIIQKVARKSYESKELVHKVVTMWMDEIINQVSAGHQITLRDFGTFGPVLRKEKVGRKLPTKEAIIIPAQYVPTFKPSVAFKESVSSKNKV